MSAVRNIVTQSLSRNGLSQYSRSAEPVIRDLERAAESVASHLRAQGRRLGASESQVNEALYASGLVERPAPPRPSFRSRPQQAQAAQGTDDSLTQAVRDLVGKVDGLVGFARQHGFRG